jgi:serine/threonine-protein kinase
MSDARWQRLQELFDGLLAEQPEDRVAWLSDAEQDEGLRREALALVAAEGSDRASMTDQFSESLARVVARRPEGLEIGPYRLIKEIGSGGMGTVFLAMRVDENFSQRVAIKLLRIPSRDSTERMLRERQILADLSHPHIARLLDGGSMPSGEPYLVMEYVEGVPINEFCKGLSLAHSLKLLQKVCGAIQYAHQRLVIHRDLKPANVLVRADGEPVLLDFGIAKLLSNSGPAAQHTGLSWFTPAYASPEQRSGLQVGTAADVYGLGVLLFEIVSGRPPPQNATGCMPLLNQATARGTLQRGVSTDLDLIIAKATHPESERRYVSASALSDDLQRCLLGWPVLAAPDSTSYRIAKFVRRHRFAAAAVVAGLVVACAFTWRLARERDRALHAEATAEKTVDYLVSLFHSASPEEAANKPIAPRELVDRGRREVDARLADAPLVRARLLGALGKIYLELGLADAAAESLGRAAELERIYGTPHRLAVYLLDQGYAFNLTERPGAAEPVLKEALASIDAFAPGNRELSASILSTLGLAQISNQNMQDGISSIERSLSVASLADGAESVIYAQCLYAFAEAKLQSGDFAAAESSAKRSVEIMLKHLPEDATEVLAARGFLADVFEQQGRYADGERLLRGMLEVRLRTVDPGSAWALTERTHLAQAIELQGRIVEATALQQQNVDLMRANHQEQMPRYRMGLNNLASLLEQAGDYSTSLGIFRDVLESASEETDPNKDPGLPTYRQNLGRSLMLNGNLEAARALIDFPIEGSLNSLDLNIQRARRLVHLAEWMRRSHHYDEASTYIEQASSAFAALYPPTHARHGAVARVRGMILRDRGRLEDAEVQLRRAADILSASAGQRANTTIDAELQLASVLFAQGKIDEARLLSERIGPLLPARFVESSVLRRQYGDLSIQLEGSKGSRHAKLAPKRDPHPH